MTDPAPFLSTIITASAALVAIIGGLLVARFVSLDSDQRASRKIIGEANERLESARHRAQEARKNRLDWHAGRFFRGSVLHAVSKGVSDATELMRLDDDWPFSIQELQPYATEVADEYSRARETLDDREASIDQFNGLDAWDNFRRVTSDLPAIRWDQVWQDVFDQIKAKRLQEQEAVAKHEREERRRERKQRTKTSPFGFAFPDMEFLRDQLTPATPDPSLLAGISQVVTDYGVINARRADELRAADERSHQQMEDYKAELGRLERDHGEIVRPDARLWWGLGILVVFAVLGVGLPAWVMSQGPKNLASVSWAFWPFAISLALLIGYIVIYLANLSGGRGQA